MSISVRSGVLVGCVYLVTTQLDKAREARARRLANEADELARSKRRHVAFAKAREEWAARSPGLPSGVLNGAHLDAEGGRLRPDVLDEDYVGRANLKVQS